MKINKTGAIFSLGLILLSQTVFSENNTMTYKNGRGSLLALEFQKNNTLSGTFTTAVASKDCQQAIGKKKPIIGYIANNAITFSASYPECNAVVTFIGNIENNKSIIDTTAIVAHQSSHIRSEGPGSRMISHDVFKKN